jgi:hypothetical protein
MCRSTTSSGSEAFFRRLLDDTFDFLPDNTQGKGLLITTPETNILLHTKILPNPPASSTPPVTPTLTVQARLLQPPTLLQNSLSIKHESPPPPSPSTNVNPFDAIRPAIVGQILPVLSPQRVLAREASVTQFDAKLESPGRVNAKRRRERRVQSLLPDIARRRKAEMESQSQSQSQSQGQSQTRSQSVCEDDAMAETQRCDTGGRSRQESVASQASQPPSSRPVSLSRESSQQGTLLPPTTTRDSSVAPPPPRLTPLELQTKEAVKQTVIAALRLHSVSPADADYKALIQHTVLSTMFALRGKLRGGRSCGMGEIGGVVEGLLEIYLASGRE